MRYGHPGFNAERLFLATRLDHFGLRLAITSRAPGTDFPAPISALPVWHLNPITGWPTPWRPPFAPPGWFRNINRMSIAYAVRPRLRPDSPDADCPCVGNLGLSANAVLTRFSLLMPAFSLLHAPPLLPVRLHRLQNAPLLPPLKRRPVASVPGLSPVIFSAQGRSTSELLRTL